MKNYERKSSTYYKSICHYTVHHLLIFHVKWNRSGVAFHMCTLVRRKISSFSFFMVRTISRTVHNTTAVTCELHLHYTRWGWPGNRLLQTPGQMTCLPDVITASSQGRRNGVTGKLSLISITAADNHRGVGFLPWPVSPWQRALVIITCWCLLFCLRAYLVSLQVSKCRDDEEGGEGGMLRDKISPADASVAECLPPGAPPALARGCQTWFRSVTHCNPAPLSDVWIKPWEGTRPRTLLERMIPWQHNLPHQNRFQQEWENWTAIIFYSSPVVLFH